ncbi:hypothetical protein [Ruminococcus flavefaciens]|uniref:hypothetical protein n=1 Tax=Ruminococcus flavefaciens TaxID=1265 RepID=UPI0026F37169|nr:hypothetical protein [Ruminococcus flavefaciens]
MNKFNTILQPAAGKDDERKKCRSSLIKLLIMLVFSLVIWIFATIAWFAGNKDVSGSGMGVKVGSDAYQIVPLDGRDSIYTEFMELIEGSSSDGFLPWKMTSQNKMDNYDSETDVGIRPGSYGAISFYVKPSDADIYLDLTFDILGYQYEETQTDGEDPGDPENNEELVRSMTPVSPELQGYLTGHILLFENRDIETVNEREVIVYSDPILPDANGKRLILKRKFKKADENTPVDIYWVWARTLSRLVEARTNDNVSAEPFCVDDKTKNDDAYDMIIQEIATNPGRFFYQYDTAKPIYSPDAGNLSAEVIAAKYNTYGEQYDRVDNEIGMHIDYITLKMESKMSDDQSDE